MPYKNSMKNVNVRFWPLADSHKIPLLVYIQTQFVTIESGQGISSYIYPLAKMNPRPASAGFLFAMLILIEIIRF